MRLVSRVSLWISYMLFSVTKFFTAITRFASSFVVAIMTPEEMVKHVKDVYDTNVLAVYGNERYVKSGLFKSEQGIIDTYATRQNGSFLILGSGGGREAIALARMGFRVTAIDNSKDMVAMAANNAAKAGVNVDFRTGDYLEALPRNEIFDYCMLSCYMYSAIPSRRMRVEALAKIRTIVSKNGAIIIHYFFNPERKRERLFKLRRLVARMCRGNTEYLPGDDLMPSLHFLRYFTDEKEIHDEAAAAELSVKEVINDAEEARYAILTKS